MFKKILIANRGEIACRVIATAQKMGIKTVAVYSDADSNSLHVQRADEAVYIGPSPANQSYLVVDNIIDACRKTGAEAVHPGYGFLSENAEFCKRLQKENIVFIGPDVEAIVSMGDKISAKEMAEKAKVTTVPGYKGEIKDPAEAAKIAKKVGFPVMLKAAAGGGGKGMRIVHKESEISQAFESATNEAIKSFSDGRVFIEKYIENPRHIEIQIIADGHGNVVCLGERECSIQRHHQKVIEEAPSAFLTDKTREKMYKESVSLAKQVKYKNAGTVEFICDQHQNYYFLEVNTRLQVEHPVSELVTGYDFVELMFKVAAGEKLPFTQKDIKLTGHAIEARVYAEDPKRGFLPSTGRISTYIEPDASENVRIDTGVYQGGEVSMFYDAMISKLITYGKDRDTAIKNALDALGSYVILGVNHNISFLEAMLSHPRFIKANLSTNFIAEEYSDGFEGAEITEDITRNLVGVAAFIHFKDIYRAITTDQQVDGRGRAISTRQVVQINEDDYSVNLLHRDDEELRIEYQNHIFNIESNWSLGSKLFRGEINGDKLSCKIARVPGGYVLEHRGSIANVRVRTPRIAELSEHMPRFDDAAHLGNLVAPIAGMIVKHNVKVGDNVVKGQELVVLEAMKMENILHAERDGVVKKIFVKANDSVQVDDDIIEFED